MTHLGPWLAYALGVKSEGAPSPRRACKGCGATTAINALEHEAVIAKVQGRLRLAPPAPLNSTDQKDSPTVKVRY